MKPRLAPIEIHLRDLPPEGRDFVYTRESGELNHALADLIHKNDYRVEFHLMPMGNTFDLRGKLITHLDLECALCALDFKFPIEQKLHELLVVQKPLEKGDQLVKNNHAHEWENKGPDYILLDADVFHVGDYIHELVGLAEPIRPLGKPDCDINCENLSEPVKKYLGYGAENAPDPIRTNPFQVLEKIKLKS
jgi:uncharacterized metal-binding protein YceD (DUF177 family)